MIIVYNFEPALIVDLTVNMLQMDTLAVCMLQVVMLKAYEKECSSL